MSLPITTRNNVAATVSVNSAPTRDTQRAQAGAVQVIYRFDGEAFHKKDSVLGTGLGAQRDRTHQLVQHQDASGNWQVHVYAVNEGRINPSGYVFTSNRPVRVEDFNNPDSVLSHKAREATKRLNADSNRLPDAAAPQTPSSSATASAKKMSTVEWLGQQGRNTVGGVTAAVTSTVGMVGSLPEKAGRFAGSVGDLGRAGVNMITGGQVAKSARNPMVIDSHAKSRSGPTNAEKGMGWAQGGINKAIGADANSKTYKTVEVVAPLLIARKGKTGGQGTTQAGSNAAGTLTTVKMTRTQPQPGNPVNNPAIRASISPVRVVKAADGSVKLSKANGQPVSLPEVVRAVANGRLTPKQLQQAKFDDASIKGIVRDARALKGSTVPKPASASAWAHDDVLKTLRSNPDVHKAMDHTRSPAEVAKTDRAVKDMEAKNVFRGAHVEPEGGGQPGSARNEPQPQRQAKPDNTTPRETQYAGDPTSKPQLNVKPARAEMNLEPGSPSSNTTLAGVEFRGVRNSAGARNMTGATANQKLAVDLFSSEARLADHYRQRPFGDKPGQSPTSPFYGGHAQTGPFAGIGGATHTEVVANVKARIASLLADDQLKPLANAGDGNFNQVYVYQPTGQVVRVGLVTSDELSGSIAMSKLQGAGHGTGARLDPQQSLYAPGTLGPGGHQSEGLGVLVMERVPGQALSRIGASLDAADRAKIAPQLADALVAMHMHGRVHADVTQRNIMFDPANGKLRLIDLGMSVRSDQALSIQSDLVDMANIVHRYGTADQSTPAPQPNRAALRQARTLYFQAIDRLPAPDRNAAVYQQHPELYDKHLAQFQSRCDALKAKVAVGSAGLGGQVYPGG
jgi:Protein kinase domain